MPRSSPSHHLCQARLWAEGCNSWAAAQMTAKPPTCRTPPQLLRSCNHPMADLHPRLKSLAKSATISWPYGTITRHVTHERCQSHPSQRTQAVTQCDSSRVFRSGPQWSQSVTLMPPPPQSPSGSAQLGQDQSHACGTCRAQVMMPETRVM